MVLSCVAILVSAVMIAGYSKGWFEHTEGERTEYVNHTETAGVSEETTDQETSEQKTFIPETIIEEKSLRKESRKDEENANSEKNQIEDQKPVASYATTNNDEQNDKKNERNNLKENQKDKNFESKDNANKSGKSNDSGNSKVLDDSKNSKTTTRAGDSKKNKQETDKQSNEKQEEENKEEKTVCWITILCDTILDNMSDLTPAKKKYVPSSGCILTKTEVSFQSGETVFDVLKRVCKENNIQIEYSWTPVYDSYYVEGINQLYEFDCGSQSGWMYQVNGWFPNYGCSAYTLKKGDEITWCFTCKGLGEDVGATIN